MIPQIKVYISTSDISLLAQALNTLALLLELSPALTFPEVEHSLLNDIYNVTHSPLVSGVALESLFRFYGSLVQADNQIATHVVPSLVISAEKVAKADSSSSNVAKCIAQVIKSQQGVAAGTIAEYSKNIKACVLLHSRILLTICHVEDVQGEALSCQSQSFDYRRAWSHHVNLSPVFFAHLY